MEWLINKMIDNPAILISAYAALISTITLVWNIINSILSNVDKILVSAGFNTSMLVGVNDELIQGPCILTVSIVNETKRIKYIKLPALKLSYHHGNKINEDENDDIVNLHFKTSKMKFPLEIKPESEIKLEYPLGAGNDWFLKNSKETSTFRVLITDTVNRKYKSKKLKLTSLKQCIEHNSKLDKAIMEFYNKNLFSSE